MIHAAFALPFLNHFANLSRLSSSALVAGIWQGTLLALTAALALRLAPRIPAAARFAIWFAVFTLVAALPMLQFAPRNPAQYPAAAPSHAFFNLDSRWTLAIIALWAAASLFRATTLIAAALRVRTLARNATPIRLSSSALIAPRRAQLCASTDIDRPTVIGFLSPKILIPAWLLERLTPAELEHVLLHEASHLNRADDWLNLLQKLALVLFPLNPALAWVERRLCFERELACDERVLSQLNTRAEAPTSYASSLTTLAEYRLQRRGLLPNFALTLGALGTSASKSARESELVRRIARILRPAARMRPLHVRLATAGAIAALLFTTTELEHSPQLISFTSPASAAQLAVAGESIGTDLLPGYRAVSTRLTLAGASQTKLVSDASPRPAVSYSRNLAPAIAAPAAPRAIALRVPVGVQHTSRAFAAHVVISNSNQPGPQPAVVITRYTVTAWQSVDGYRLVRTSAVISDAPPTGSGDATENPSTTGHDDLRVPHSCAAGNAHMGGGVYRSTYDSCPHARQISQPYAAVPVPGGWLIFQL